MNAVTLLFVDDMQINEMRSASNAEVHTLLLGLSCIIPPLFAILPNEPLLLIIGPKYEHH